MYLTLPELLSETRSVIRRLEAVGVRVPPGSRLHSYAAAIESALPYQSARLPDDTMRVCHRLLFEILDLSEIIDVFSGEPSSVGWEALIAEALGGGVLVSDERRHARARDIQFELAVGAFLRRKGCDVRFDEPDVVATIQGVTFGVAAKRPRSRAKLVTNIRGAAKQLAKCGLPGLIAIDTSVVVNLHDGHFVSETEREESLVSIQATELSKYVMKMTVQHANAQTIYGVLCRVAIPVWDVPGQRAGLVHQWTPVSLAINADPDRTSVQQMLNMGLQRRSSI